MNDRKHHLHATMSALVLLVFLLLGPSALTETTKLANLHSTRELMDQFLAQLTALKPYVVSEALFDDPQNTVVIGDHLQKFVNLAKKAGHDPQLGAENFKFSRDVLLEHIEDTVRVFRLGHKSYARWELNSTLTICASCHTQMPTPPHIFAEFQSLKTFSSEFDQAEFLFAVRDFDHAMKIFDQLIDHYPQMKTNAEQVEKSLEREVAYFARVRQRPDEAIVALQNHLKNKLLPEYLQKNVKIWIGQFQSWNSQLSIDPQKASGDQVVEFAKTQVEKAWKDPVDATNPHLVTYLRVSGVLYKFLSEHPPSKVTPEILYWLSICDRSVGNEFFYSLADLYLRECIIRYPKEPIAKKCFKEYEAVTTLGYTGSMGVDVPPEVRADLRHLKKLVEGQEDVVLPNRAN